MKIEKILQMSKERIGYKLYQSKLNILKWSLGGFIMGVLALSIMFTSHHALAFISCMTLGICSFVGSIVCGVESITDWNKFKNNRIFSIFDSEKSLIVLSSEEIQELFKVDFNTTQKNKINNWIKNDCSISYLNLLELVDLEKKDLEKNFEIFCKTNGVDKTKLIFVKETQEEEKEYAYHKML